MKSATLLLSALACSAVACAAPPYEESTLSEPSATESAAAPDDDDDTWRWEPEVKAERETRAERWEPLPPVEPPKDLEPPPCRSVFDVVVANDEDAFGPYFTFTYEDACHNEALVGYVWQLPREDELEGAYGPLEGVLYSADVEGETAFRLTGEWIEDSNGDRNVNATVENRDQWVVGTMEGRVAFDAGLPASMFGVVNYE